MSLFGKPTRRKHDIILIKDDMLLCHCGEEIHLTETEMDKTSTNQLDTLLDRHVIHRSRQERNR